MADDGSRATTRSSWHRPRRRAATGASRSSNADGLRMSAKCGIKSWRPFPRRWFVCSMPMISSGRTSIESQSANCSRRPGAAVVHSAADHLIGGADRIPVPRYRRGPVVCDPPVDDRQPVPKKSRLRAVGIGTPRCPRGSRRIQRRAGSFLCVGRRSMAANGVEIPLRVQPETVGALSNLYAPRVSATIPAHYHPQSSWRNDFDRKYN